MARTVNGNLTGRAASTELREQRERIREEQEKYREEYMLKYGYALDCLRALDPDWSAWYDNQPQQTTQDMYPVILARIEELKETEELIKLARGIRSTMKDSIQSVQMQKAEWALQYHVDSLERAGWYGGKGRHSDWMKWMFANAEYFLSQARMFLNTEYTG